MTAKNKKALNQNYFQKNETQQKLNILVKRKSNQIVTEIQKREGSAMKQSSQNKRKL
jgi:hypothetical protein